MADPRRIDVHQHIVVPTWSAELNRRELNSGGWAIPSWSADEAIAMMDRQGIATGILSTTAPGVHLTPGDDAKARSFARAVNDESAELIADNPDRFGLFASVPLPDVEGSLAEITYAFDELNADGVVLMSNTHGRYLGDPAYDEVWAELDRRAASIFIHPNQPPLPLLAGTPAPLVDYVFDTTRTAVNMVNAGVMDRYRNIKVILSHGGGFLPYAVYRFAGIGPVIPGQERTTDELLEDFRRFYFDTALTASPTSLPSLTKFAAPGHILYGSDWPFAPETAGEYFTTMLDCDPNIDAEQAAAINRGGAEKLFPRLA